MTTRKIIFQFVGLIFSVILFLGLWYFIAIPENEKLPDDYNLYIQHEGEDQIEDKIFEGLSEPFRLEEDLVQNTIGVNEDILTIKSTIIGYKEENKEPIFNSENVYHVNRYTLTHAESGKLFDFGHGVKKQNYNSFHPLIFHDATLVFDGIEQTPGFELYIFKSDTKGLDYTSTYPRYEGYTVLGDSLAKLWVEPITGNLIKFEQDWEIYVLIENEKHIIEKGKKHTTEFTETILRKNTMVGLENFNYTHWIIPFSFSLLISGLGTLAIIGTNYIKEKSYSRQREKIAIVGELASRFSHDVRNPLSNINLAVGLLEKDQEVNSNPAFKEKLDSIQKNLQRINHQVNNVLDFIRKPQIEKTNVALASCLKDSISSLKIPKNVKINLPRGKYTFFGDPYYMQIVFKNLILNSIQAIGGKGGNISVNFESNADWTIIKIQDSGPGIQGLELNEIFEPLTTTKQHGTGLGLVSCKNIIQSHGGKISAKNNPTEFTIELPKK